MTVSLPSTARFDNTQPAVELRNSCYNTRAQNVLHLKYEGGFKVFMKQNLSNILLIALRRLVIRIIRLL